MYKEVFRDRVEYRNEFGDLHSYDDKPAVEYKNGDCFWYKNGNFHRDNGLPAIIRGNGTKQWWINGSRTREDGPAIEWSNGAFTWALDSIVYESEEKFREVLLSKKLKRLKNL